MPEKKTDISADFSDREKQQTVVQRFITVEDPPDELFESSEQQQKYYLKNTLEDAVVDEVKASLKHISDVCKCDKCFYDICAIALNVFPSHYATSEQGELIKKAYSMLNIEMRNKISKAVFSAIEMVKKSPMHDDIFFDPPVYEPAEPRTIGAIVSKDDEEEE